MDVAFLLQCLLHGLGRHPMTCPIPYWRYLVDALAIVQEVRRAEDDGQRSASGSLLP